MKTICVQIGNSDDKLCQKTWSDFCESIRSIIGARGQIHFSGCSEGSRPWQNLCVVAVVDEAYLDNIRRLLSRTAKQFSQDSIALLCGETEFVEATP